MGSFLFVFHVILRSLTCDHCTVVSFFFFLVFNLIKCTCYVCMFRRMSTFYTYVYFLYIICGRGNFCNSGISLIKPKGARDFTKFLLSFFFLFLNLFEGNYVLSWFVNVMKKALGSLHTICRFGFLFSLAPDSNLFVFIQC